MGGSRRAPGDGGRVAQWRHIVQPGLGDADAAATAEAFAQLEPVLRRTGERGWDAEPPSVFDAGAPFAAEPAAAWPRDAGGRPDEPGPLALDLHAVAAGEATPAAILDRYRVAIAALQPQLNAFITVCPPDSPQASPSHGALRGAALAVKDIVATAGVRTTGGSLQLRDHRPDADAECWRRLREAGAALLGKTNTHEFAAGTTNENAAYGPVRNPYDAGRVSGGSSGGSAAAVAAGLAAAALGTDTGGSVRIPAACCGVVGLKPTYGRVSRAGVFPLSWSLDHVGPIAATVGDAAILFAAMAGPDPRDPATWRQPPVGEGGACSPWRPAPRRDLAGVRVGVPYTWLEAGGDGDGASPAVRAAFARALEAIGAIGATVAACDLGSPDHATAVNRAIAFPESAAWHAPFLDEHPEAYGANVRARLLAGRFVTAEEYLQAQRARSVLCRRYAAALQGPRGLHLIATPTLPIVAPSIGAPAAEALALLRYCAPFNVAGWPAVTLPCGLSPEGLPVGLQLAAAPYMEADLLAAAAAVALALGGEARPRPGIHA